MSTKLFGSLALSVGFLLAPISAFARHGGGSLYDLSKVTTLKATVTQPLWTNPHCEIHHYIFELYAVDQKPDLTPDASRVDVMKAIDGHVIGASSYVGVFQDLILRFTSVRVLQGA